MDPLSVTASVIALIQAAVGIAKGVEFIRSLGEIPAEFCDLLNELSTLQAVAAQIETTLKGYENQRLTNGSAIILPNLDTSILTSLQNDLAQITTDLEALCNRLKKSGKEKSTGQEQVSKRKWHKERSNIARLREKVRATRQYLNLCFAAFTSSQASQQVRIALNIQEVVYSSAQDISQLKAQSGLIQEQNHKLLESLQVLSNQERNRTGDSNKTTKSSMQTAIEPMVYFRATSIQACLHVCNCACHKVKYSQSPGWLASTVGRLCLQYNAIPFFHHVTCDVLSCKPKSDSSLRLYYAFPRWLIGRSIDFAISWSSLTGAGSSLYLRVPRVNVGIRDIQRAFNYDDIRCIQLHIAEKSIFPTDINTWGQTLVQQAVQSWAFEVAIFLVQQGFDIKSKDIDGRTAIMTARRIYLTRFKDSTTTKYMRSLRRFLEEISLQQSEDRPTFASEIHRAIIQEAGDSLDVIVTRNLPDLNTIDSLGYAPIHWAALKGNLEATRILLEANAENDIPTIEGGNALGFAVLSGQVRIVRLLLDHGADANYSRPGIGRPITYSFGYPEIIRLLLKYGARPYYKTAGGHIWGPLEQCAHFYLGFRVEDKAQTAWAESLKCLISAGVNINDQSDPGRVTPIMWALRNRNALLVDLLIDAGAQHDLVDNDGDDILHWAALSTDDQSIEVLRRARISGIDPDRPDNIGFTPLIYLYRRLFGLWNDASLPGGRQITNDEFWAFKQLIEEIRMRNEEERRLRYTDLDSDESVEESSTEWETISVDSFPVDFDSERAEWGGSQNLRWESDEGSLVFTDSDHSLDSSDCSGSESGSELSDHEEFFDAEE
ncbi:ankyrin [Hypomontagnella monticulosa]|nr:ankyrin [Hypomontagnella monticulosa]